MADEQTGAPSTPEVLDAAQDAALASNDFERYAETENARDKNLALPEAPPPSKVTSDKTPAPEPGTEKEIQETRKPKTGEDRKLELAAEIKELLKQRAELKGVKVADPPAAEPVKVAPVVPVKAAEAAPGAPAKPSIADFQTVGEFEDAKDKYVDDLVAFRLVESEQKREAAAAEKISTERSNTRIAAAKEEFADFAEVAFSPTTPISGVMLGFLKESEQEFRLLYKLGEDDGAEAKRIHALPAYAQVRELIKIEDALPSRSKKEAIAPPVKKHTAAPAPATSLGSNTVDADDSGASMASGDFAAYAAKENAKEKKAAGR
jgi:hypothetical protein